MQHSEIPMWVGIASAGAAWLALLLSVFNFNNARKSLRLSEQQDLRRKPLLVPYLQDGYISKAALGDAQFYAFLLSVSNRSDSNNAIANVAIRLSYSRQTEIHLTVNLEALAATPTEFAVRTPPILQVPIAIGAHESLSGWCFFRLDKAVLKDGRVERIIIVIIDSHGNEVIIEPMIIREYAREIQGPAE